MHDDPIRRFRRFSRAVTTEVGALDASFLGRGRPLGAARVLNAAGKGRREVAEIRDYLGLDTGLMSRLLRSLESEGLIKLSADPQDARRRVVTLTSAGQAEFKAYEALSDEQARAVLDRHKRAAALLEAMDLVAPALGRDRIELKPEDPRAPAALHCLGRYYDELARRFDQGFDVSLSCDPEAGDMMPPRGVFLIAWSDDLPVGWAGLKGHGGGTAEVKRVWVAPAARGLGLARRLMASIETAARAKGVTRLLLDTNSRLPEAVAMYRHSGWTQIERFNDDPYPDVFFEKRL